MQRKFECNNCKTKIIYIKGPMVDKDAFLLNIPLMIKCGVDDCKGVAHPTK